MKRDYVHREEIPSEDVRNAMAAADALYHGIAFNIQRALEDVEIEISEQLAHQIATTIIVQELDDHLDATHRILGFYSLGTITEIPTGEPIKHGDEDTDDDDDDEPTQGHAPSED